MKTLAAGLALCALVTGCNGIPTPFVTDPVLSQFFVVNSGPPLPLMFQGSAIQWNEDYAVTAKHIPFLWHVAHEGKGDLVFFKHKSKKVPQWRQYTGGERLTAAGFSPFFIPVKGTGHALASRVVLSDVNDGVRYSVADLPLVKGMSGGPVFADDAKVVGIVTSFLPHRYFSKSPNPEIANSQRVSIFMPYDEIQKEWEIFAKQLQAKAPDPV
ncbi:serine protease [Pseudomonas serbica]|uniref:serine protease n=1 Tax=Pseudomonas serbica TaxID=2965074 RepID=UPI00237BB99E|nr:serine protease [Pseudomonas serbica]